MDLKAKAKKLPETPGVYVMKDSQGNILYIGKAKSLRNRVSQYFQNSRQHPPKILRLIEGIRDFDYIYADTELEALLLECRLIKDIKPMYNSQLKNHRKYVYICINTDEKYPTLGIEAEKTEQGICYGPYTSQNNVERAVDSIKETLKLRHCSNYTVRHSGCLNFQLGLCSAPCAGEIQEADYKGRIADAVSFLKGSKSDLIKQTEAKMIAAAERLDFNKAAKYRDDIKALAHLSNKQKTIKFTGSSKLVAALEKVTDMEYKLFLMKGSRVIYKERLDASVGRDVVEQYTFQLVLNYKEELIKNEFLEIEKDEIDQAQIVYSYLKNKKDCCYVTIAKSWLNKNDTTKLQQAIKKLMISI